MTAHRIRLRGPWELQWVGNDAVPSHRVRLPAEWLEVVGNQVGVIRLTRRFHKPSHMGPGERADLVFQHWPGRWAVTLNARAVETIEDCGGPEHRAVTDLLEPSNVLTLERRIEPGSASMPASSFGEVSLEIRSD